MKRCIVLLGLVGLFSFHLHNIEAAPAILEDQEEIQSLTGIESNEQVGTKFETLLPLNDETLSGEILRVEEIVDANILDANENTENDSRETTKEIPTLQEAIQIIKNEVILNRTKNRYVDSEMNPEFANLERVEPESELELDLELDESNNLNTTEETAKPENIIHFGSGHLKYLPVVTKSPLPLQSPTATNSTQQQQLVGDNGNDSGNFSIESLIQEDLELDNNSDQNETNVPNFDSGKSVGVLLVSEIEVNSITNETVGQVMNEMEEELDWDSNQEEVELEAQNFNSVPTRRGKKIINQIPKHTDKSNIISQHSTTRNTTLSRPLVVGKNVTDGQTNGEESIILGLVPIEMEIREPIGNFKTSSEFSIEYERLSDLEDEYSERENGKTAVEIILPEIDLRDDNDLDQKSISKELQGVQDVDQEIAAYSSHPFYFLVGPFNLPNNSIVPSSFFQIQADPNVFSSAPFIIHLDDAKGKKAEAQTPEVVIQALAEKQAYSIFPRLK